MSGKEKLLLEKKILAYSLTAGALLGSNSIEASVQYTDISPDATIGTTPTYSIDLEGGVHGTGFVPDYDLFIEINAGGNSFYVRAPGSGTDFLGTFNATLFRPYALTSNADILATPATGVWGKNVAFNLGQLNLNDAAGNWLGTTSNRFVGIKFTSEDDSQIHYGFVELSVDYSSTQITIHGYGYETVANTGITQALPVELTSFTALIKDNSVELNWDTATEVNNYGFNVERRPETGDWEKIGFVNGHGNSNAPKSYSFVDEEITAGKVYYRLKQIDFDGRFEYSNIIEVQLSNSLPTNFVLNQNYPNPFNPTTVISYQLSADSQTKLEIFDSIGRLVATLVDEKQSAGTYSYNFNAEELPSGTYAYRLTTDGFSETKKMLLIK